MWLYLWDDAEVMRRQQHIQQIVKKHKMCAKYVFFYVIVIEIVIVIVIVIVVVILIADLDLMVFYFFCL